MNPAPDEREKRLIELFNEARELPIGKQRDEFLEQACGKDEDIRSELHSLLRAGHSAADYLQAGPAVSPQLEAEFARLQPEEAGDRIGPYKLLQQIGEGGFGTVWVAEQERPVRRRVALKIIKLGMDTKEVIARFEQERQALAMMDHPNIAKVFDAGCTAIGRPFFVMELVRGVKITEYCDQANLSTPERLQLFIPVCQAVQHAHQKGIIHRDLKPANILVTLHDGVPVPKVIDFGVAKATQQQRLTELTVYTQFEQMIGTPAYMSPEQAEMSGLDIDTRSDIYSLGVLLYELLTGRTPFDPRELMSQGLDEIRRLIRQQEPKKPSTAVETMAVDARATVAQHRQSDAGKLAGLIRGDLDWIVMKCMEKDRTRRYETASSLASDVQRHLDHEPIIARPPSRAYQFRKFVRRNKLAFTAGTAVVVALVAGIALSVSQAIRANRNSDETRLQAARASEFAALEKQQRQHADKQKSLAEAHAVRLAHQLYASEMNVGFRSLESGDVSRALALLAKYVPKPGEEDLRGFEWYLLWRLCHGEQLELTGHNSRVRSVAFSPDGRLLATGGDDSLARLWDAQTGREVSLLRGHAGKVAALAFSPDGKTLATGSFDRTFRLWDVTTGGELFASPNLHQVITALAFSPDGRWVALATGKPATGAGNPITRFADNRPMAAQIKLWDILERRELATLRGHTHGILALAVSPDGKRLATGCADRTVKVWDVNTGSDVSTFGPFKGPIFTVGFSPDGQTLAIGGGDPYSKVSELKLLDPVTGREQLDFKATAGPIFSVAFQPRGNALASTGLDQVVRLWNYETGSELRAIRGHRAAVWSLAFDPTGKRLASAGWDASVKVWYLAAQAPARLNSGTTSYAVAFSPDSKYVASAKHEVIIHDVADPSNGVTLPDYRSSDTCMAFTPDGSQLITAGADERVTFWEVGTWRRLASLPGRQAKIWCMAICPDGLTVATGGNDVRLWDVKMKRERAVIQPGMGTISTLAYTKDGRTLIVGTWEDLLFLDAVTHEVQRRLPEPGSLVAVSPDGRFLAVVRSQDFGMKLMDLETQEVKWTIKPHHDVIWSVRFSPDSKTLATSSWDGTAKLWNVASGLEMFTYSPQSVVWGQSFSPDGMTWAVGSNQGLALLERATQKEVEAGR